MSPQRKKGRGGGGGKTMAPRPCPTVHSPDPLVPLKLTRERRASTTQLTSSTRSKQLRADGPKVSSADQPRISAGDHTKVSPAIHARASVADQGKTSSADHSRLVNADKSRVSSTDEARVSSSSEAKASVANLTRVNADQASTSSVDEAKAPSIDESKVSSAIQTRVYATDQARVSSAGQAKVYATELSKGQAPQTSKVSVAEKARASSATRTRVSSVENFRSLVASSRCITDALPGSQGASRRMSTKLRAESRPRTSRASPSTSAPRKEPSERGTNETSRLSSATLLVRSRSSIGNVREESKKLAKISGTFPAYSEASKVDPSLLEKASNREPFRSLKSSAQREASSEPVRWSTTTLPLSAQNIKKGVLGSACCQSEVGWTKPGQAKQPATHHGRLSTGSCSLPLGNNLNHASEPTTLNSRALAKCRTEQDMAKESRGTELVHHKKPGATHNFSSSLHNRLALLESKVSQIASEIKKTKELLDSNDGTNSEDRLIDIQGKITSIERAMSCTGSIGNGGTTDDDVIMEDGIQAQRSIVNDQEGRSSFESFTRNRHLHFLKVPMSSEHEIYLKRDLLHGSNSAPPKVFGLTHDWRYLEELFFPHQKLFRSHRRLHETEIENSTPLHSELLESALHRHVEDPNNKRKSEKTLKDLISEPVTCEKKTNPPAETVFNKAMCGQYNSNNLCDEIGRDGIAKRTNLRESNTTNPAPGLERQHGFVQRDHSFTQGPVEYAGNTMDALECNESPLSESNHENSENITPHGGVDFAYDDCSPNQLRPIGDKVATAGWYVSEGEAILLAHDDGCCSYHDVANMEEKAIYAAPTEIAPPLWNDCWLIRAAGSDGRSNKYVVVATAGNALDCGFCSWDFYSKRVAAYHTEYQSTPPIHSPQGSPSLSNMQLSPFQSNMCLPFSDSTILRNGRAPENFDAKIAMPTTLYNSKSFETDCIESPQWWYRPCGALMASTASSLRNVVLYDIRDGDAVMSWEMDQPIVSLDYTSPLQWRDKGKLVLAEQQAISVWDVNTMDVQCLQYVQLPGKQISALHLHNSDAECSGGVRQRLSSSETEAYDGVCCTRNDVNVLDFRVPNGIGICFSNPGQDMHSVYARGDMILTGGLNRESHECGVQQWSVRKGMSVCTYAFPASSSHYTHIALTQVWGSSSMVMAVNGNGLYIFKGWKEAMEGVCGVEEVKDVVGTQDLYSPSFDYSNSRVLLISRDRQAHWSYWPQ